MKDEVINSVKSLELASEITYDGQPWPKRPLVVNMDQIKYAHIAWPDYPAAKYGGRKPYEVVMTSPTDLWTKNPLPIEIAAKIESGELLQTSIQIGGSTIESLMEKIARQEMYLSDTAEEMISYMQTWSNYPTQATDIQLVRLKAEDLTGKSERSQYSTIVVAAEEKGFQVCPKQTALWLRLLDKEQPNGTKYFVGMEEIRYGIKGTYGGDNGSRTKSAPHIFSIENTGSKLLLGDRSLPSSGISFKPEDEFIFALPWKDKKNYFNWATRSH